MSENNIENIITEECTINVSFSDESKDSYETVCNLVIGTDLQKLDPDDENIRILFFFKKNDENYYFEFAPFDKGIDFLIEKDVVTLKKRFPLLNLSQIIEINKRKLGSEMFSILEKIADKKNKQ